MHCAVLRGGRKGVDVNGDDYVSVANTQVIIERFCITNRESVRSSNCEKRCSGVLMVGYET